MRKGDNLKTKVLWCAVTLAGLIILINSLWQVAHMGRLQLVEYTVFMLLTAVVGAFPAFFPNSQTKISVTEAVVFATVALFGPAPAAILATIDGYLGSKKSFNGKKNSLSSIVYCSAMLTVSVFISALCFNWVVRAQGIDPRNGLTQVGLGPLVLGLTVMALVNGIINTTAIAAILGLRTGKSVFVSLKQDHFLPWILLGNLAGASAAGLIYFAIIKIGFLSLFLALPIMLVIHLTYSNYYQKVEEKNRHISETTRLYTSIIETLAVAIDAKDQTTHGHVRRVQTYAEELGKVFNLEGPQLEALKAAAILHDVGKLAVPDYILNKPHKLTEAEFAKMKIHAAVGGDMLKNVGFPFPVDVVVRHHHERWDGKGYPDGLKGKEIPLAARILTVVDFFDATTCTRPYRTGMPEDESIALLRNGSGSQFDPQVVETFIARLPELKNKLRERMIPLEESSLEAIREAAIQSGSSNVETYSEATVLPTSVLDSIASAQREVFALYEIAQTFSSSLNLKDMLAIIASKLESIVPFTTCVINLIEGQSGDVVARHVVGEHIDFFKTRRYRPGVGVTGWVVANKRPMYNTAPDLDFTQVEREMSTNYSTVAVFPLVKGDDALGTISLYSADLREYSVDHIRLMEIVAQQASDAINNAIIYEEAKTTAMTDLLTGLLNGRAFYTHCEQEIANAAKFNHQLTLLNMDLDGFKQINDNYGHQVGDRLLIQVAQVLRRQFREADILTRYAGDEFLAILPTIDRRTAIALTERIQRAIDRFHYKLRDGKSVSLGISIGSASFPEDGRTIEELMAQADKRMYENKKVRNTPAKPGQAEIYKFRQQVNTRKN